MSDHEKAVKDLANRIEESIPAAAPKLLADALRECARRIEVRLAEYERKQ